MDNNNNIEVVDLKRCCYCNSEVSTEKGVQWGRYFYCDRCFKDNKCMVDSYHNPSIDTSFKRSKKDSSTENLYLGIELEITKAIYGRCTQSEHIDNVFYIRKNFKELGLNFETDSSIGDGMEIVTQPMTYKYFKENQDKFKSIFEYLTSKGYFSHDKGKCGLHIHVSKNALGDTNEKIQQTIEKIMLFVETYRNNMELFSRRKHQEFSSYNCYTIPYHKQHSSGNYIKNDDYYKSGKMLYEINKNDCIGHSSVVNTDTSTGETVEFRMFRGTLKYETFVATIEFVNNLVHVCKENMTSKISWNKVINYGGEFIKDYVDSLNIIDSNMYLRDYTKQIETNIEKENVKNKVIIDKYKKDLSEIEVSLQNLLNQPINFNNDIKQVRSILNFRKLIYDALSNILVDTTENESQSLYIRLTALSMYNYNETCKSNLKALKRTLESYTCYKLDDDMITVVKNSIETIKDILNKENNTETIY